MSSSTSRPLASQLLLAASVFSTSATAELPTDGRWAEIGPALGLFGGIAADTGDPSLVIAAGRNQGLFRSTDGGRTWTRGEPLSFGNRERTLHADPHQPGAFYAVTAFTGRLSRSTDGGVTWGDVPGTFTGPASTFAADPVNPGVIYVGTSSDGVARSTDGGASWTRIDQTTNAVGGLYIQSIAVDPLDPNLVYISTQSSDPGIVRATLDAGSWSFESVNNGLASPSNAVLAFDASGVLFAAVGNGVSAFSGPPQDQWTSAMHPGGAQVVFAHPQQAGLLFTGGSQGIHRTTTSGDSWALEAVIELGEAVAFARADTTVAASTGFGVLKRSGADWSRSNRGLNAGEMTALIVDPQTENRYLASAAGVGLLKSLDGGNTWATSGTGLPPRASVSRLLAEPGVGGRWFASQGDDFYLSEDAGETWKNLDPSDVVTADIRGVVLTDSATVFLGAIGNGGGVYRGDISDVDNVVWTLENSGLTNTLVVGLDSDEGSGDLFALTFGAGVFRGRDTMAGLAWTRVPDNGPVSNFGNSIAVDQSRGLAYFVNTNGSIYRLDLDAVDGTFVQLSENLPGSSGTRLFTPTGTGRLVASAAENGLFSSTDDGVTWTPLGDLFPFGVVAVVEDVHATDRYLAASLGASVARIAPELVFRNGFEN